MGVMNAVQGMKRGARGLGAPLPNPDPKYERLGAFEPSGVHLERRVSDLERRVNALEGNSPGGALTVDKFLSDWGIAKSKKKVDQDVRKALLKHAERLGAYDAKGRALVTHDGIVEVNAITDAYWREHG